MEPVPFNWNDEVPSQIDASTPAFTTGAGLICIWIKSCFTIEQIPIPVADKVAVTIPEAPAVGTITGVNVFSVPAWIVAGPLTLHE